MSILIENVSKQFGDKIVLDNINLEIKTGSLVALLGSSGSGKSTLLRLVAGFEQPDTGRVWLHGKDSQNLSVQEKEIGFVFQAYALFQHLTVYENIAFGMSINRSPFYSLYSLNWVKPIFQQIFQNFSFLKKPFMWWPKTHMALTSGADINIKGTSVKKNEIKNHSTQALGETKSDLKSVEELLRVVKLEELAHRYPNQLSGGQCQRVALARALAVQPKVLLLDEPFGALDMKVRKQLRRWLRQLHEKVGVTTLFVTHDHQEAMEVANEIVVLDNGRVKHSLQSPQKIYNRLGVRKGSL